MDGVTSRGVDSWKPVVTQFVDRHYESIRGRVRTFVIHEHLKAHLPPPPATVVDIGGGGGNQSMPLAQEGYSVTIVDPSPAMLERAAERIVTEMPDVASRVRLIEGTGEDAPALLSRAVFDCVLCHGVLMYVTNPVPLVEALCALTGDGGLCSIVTKNVETMALRPALEGDWRAALSAFDVDQQINALGMNTRGDSVKGLSTLVEANGLSPVAWFGVRLFTDGWTDREPADGEQEELLLRVELEASQRDPYRRMSRLFHLLGRRGR